MHPQGQATSALRSNLYQPDKLVCSLLRDSLGSSASTAPLTVSDPVHNDLHPPPHRDETMLAQRFSCLRRGPRIIARATRVKRFGEWAERRLALDALDGIRSWLLRSSTPITSVRQRCIRGQAGERRGLGRFRYGVRRALNDCRNGEELVGVRWIVAAFMAASLRRETEQASGMTVQLRTPTVQRPST